jgi:hypothetical protein
MKNLKMMMVAMLAGSLLAGCSKSVDPSAGSPVSLSMTASSNSTGKATMLGRVAATTVSLTDVQVSVRDIKFDFDAKDGHFKKDSTFVDHDQKLNGPFVVDLLNAGSFVDQIITSVVIPNAKYQKVSFSLSPDTVAGAMLGKTILIAGTVDTTKFVFWHNGHARFGAHMVDSTSLTTNGAAVNLAIQLELDKVLSVVNGGVDLTLAKDGNKDGIITIDPLNTDGNKHLADEIFFLLLRHAHCKRH